MNRSISSASCSFNLFGNKFSTVISLLTMVVRQLSTSLTHFIGQMLRNTGFSCSETAALHPQLHPQLHPYSPWLDPNFTRVLISLYHLFNSYLNLLQCFTINATRPIFRYWMEKSSKSSIISNKYSTRAAKKSFLAQMSSFSLKMYLVRVIIRYDLIMF